VNRILFVDDEQRILEGLRDLLRRRRREWEMEFALGAAAALTELERAQYDVVVSDMRMPGMDGASLLAEVQQRDPEAIRIVLSGQTDLQAAMRAIPVAHMFVVKPCDGDELQNVLTRSLALRDLLKDEQVRAAVTETGTLPSLPEKYVELTNALQDPDVGIDRVASIVEGDMGMCAKLLQLVNSSFFGLARRITSIREGVAYLGLDVVRMLVLSADVFLALERDPPIPGLDVELLQRHSLLTGRLASQFVTGPQLADGAFLAGVLHDVGKFILGTQQRDRFAPLVAEARATGEPLHVVESRAGWVTHAEVGAYLLGLWGLPYPVVEAVAHHHAPDRVAQQGVDVLAAVYVANSLLHEVEGDEPTPPVDRDYLATLGATDRLDVWRDRASRLVFTKEAA
jgi:HD-like signal output (HDOD) protein